MLGLTRGCLCASPGGRPRTLAVCRGRPPVDARRLLCAGFRQCGSCVEVCAVDLRLVDGGWLVLVRGGGSCCVVGGGLREGVALVCVRLDVVPLPTRASSQTVAGCRLGGFPVGRDRWGGERVVGVLPLISIGAWGLCDSLCLVLVCGGRCGLGGVVLLFILGSSLGGVGPVRGLRGGGRGGWCEEWARSG